MHHYVLKCFEMVLLVWVFCVHKSNLRTFSWRGHMCIRPELVFLLWNLQYMKLLAYFQVERFWVYTEELTKRSENRKTVTSLSLPSCVYLVCAVPVCTQNRDVPVTFHIDFHFIAGHVYHDSEGVNLVLLSYTHLLWQYSYHLMLFSCLSWCVTVTSDSSQHGCFSSWFVP